jgi:hypothetical protein
MKPVYKTDIEMHLTDPPQDYDNTMFSMFRTCHRRLYWFLRGVESKIRPAYFAFGTAWQLGQEAWYLTEGTTSTRLEAAIHTASKHWNDSGAVPDTTNSLEKLQYLLIWYSITYPTEHWSIVPNRNAMELGFRLPLKGTPYFLTGALDGYLSWSPHGMLDLENKTTGLHIGGQNSAYMRQWSFSTQVTQYFWALGQVLGKMPFGILMNIASKRFGAKEMLSFKQNLTIPENVFCRNLEKRSARDLEEFELNKITEILQIQACWEQRWWTKTTDGRVCVGGMGYAACPYLVLCNSDFYPEEIENPANFEGLTWRKEAWEPWKRGSLRGDD